MDDTPVHAEKSEQLKKYTTQVMMVRKKAEEKRNKEARVNFFGAGHAASAEAYT